MASVLYCVKVRLDSWVSVRYAVKTPAVKALATMQHSHNELDHFFSPQRRPFAGAAEGKTNLVGDGFLSFLGKAPRKSKPPTTHVIHRPERVRVLRDDLVAKVVRKVVERDGRPTSMVIGQYRIIEKIGEGGMGVIYKAEHCALEQIVAIKALPGSLSVNSDLRERFIKEAKIQAKLSHPNVVNIHNFFEFEGNHYIVMEYVEGETLEALIKSRGLIPPDLCITMFRQILAGIGYAHSMGIIHRDVKPSNLIIKKDGSVKITDFGIAKISGEIQKTRTGVKVGTLWYMPPEQVKGQPAGVQSDIYALGVTLFEMITGKVPFSGDSEYSIMKNIVECSPPSPRDFYPYVPIPLERTILKALAKDPADRFKSIAEFQAALLNPKEFTVEAQRSTEGPASAEGLASTEGPASAEGLVSTEAPTSTEARASAKSQTIEPDTIQVPREASRRPRMVLLTGGATVAALAAVAFVFATGTQKKPAAPPSSADAAAVAPRKPAAQEDAVKDIRPLQDLLKTAQLSLSQHHYQKAVEAYEKVLAADQGNQEALRGKEKALALEEQKTRETVADLLATAHTAHRKGNYDRAIELYLKVLALAPGNREATQGKEDSRSARIAEERVGLRK